MHEPLFEHAICSTGATGMLLHNVPPHLCEKTADLIAQTYEIISKKLKNTSKAVQDHLSKVIKNPLEHQYTEDPEILSLILPALAVVAQVSIQLHSLQNKSGNWSVELDTERSVQVGTDLQVNMLVWAEMTPFMHYDLLLKVKNNY